MCAPVEQPASAPNTRQRIKLSSWAEEFPRGKMPRSTAGLRPASTAAQTFESAVSQAFQPAVFESGRTSGLNRRDSALPPAADWKVGDIAVLEARATITEGVP